MRKIFWPVVGLAGLAVIAGGLLLYRATPTPTPVSATVALRAAPPGLAIVPEALAPADATAAAPPETPPAAPAETLPATPPATPAEATASAGSDLPVVQVAPRVVHAVPEKEPDPPAPVTVMDKSGHVMTRIMPRPAPATTVATAAPPPPVPLNGAAQAAGSTLINVSGQPVRLFGVRPPEPTDVCLSREGHARPCSDVAREAMASRLASFAGVHCRLPAGQRSDAGAICLDGAGVDLAGFLVGEGLALANSQESHDYVGAEGVARANRRGLWHYR